MTNVTPLKELAAERISAMEMERSAGSSCGLSCHNSCHVKLVEKAVWFGRTRAL